MAKEGLLSEEERERYRQRRRRRVVCAPRLQRRLPLQQRATGLKPMHLSCLAQDGSLGATGGEGGEAAAPASVAGEDSVDADDFFASQGGSRHTKRQEGADERAPPAKKQRTPGGGEQYGRGEARGKGKGKGKEAKEGKGPAAPHPYAEALRRAAERKEEAEKARQERERAERERKCKQEQRKAWRQKLSKKTRRGQPVLSNQVDRLLDKIQRG